MPEPAGPDPRLPRPLPIRVAGTLRLALLVLLLAVCGWVGCGDRRATADAQRTILERERASLESYLATPADSPVVSPGDVLITVRDDLFESVLDAGLPQTGIVADRFRVTLQSADVRIRSGLALVALAGRASLRDQPDVFADVTVFGLLEIVELDPVSSTLRARVEVVGLETREVGVRGLSPPAERLVDALARRKTEEFNQILSDLEIPVSVRERVELPPVQEDEVTATGGTLSLEVRIRDVKTVGDRVWISVTAELTSPWPEPTEAADTGAPAGPNAGADTRARAGPRAARPGSAGAGGR